MADLPGSSEALGRPPAALESKPFRFKDPRQERIFRRLRLIGPGSAGFYHDACRLMERPAELTATSHIVAHLLRDIESALRDVLEGITGERATEGLDSTNHKDEIQAILRALEIPLTEPVANAWIKLADKGEDGLAKRAHREHLAAPRPVDDGFRSLWARMQFILDAILERFESRFLKVIPLLEQLLAKEKPTCKDAKTLKNHVPNNLVTLGYFFDRLKSPAWLEPLHAEGLFKHPPEPVRDDDRGTVRFPPWPQSRYLARVAEHDPATVAEIIDGIPERGNVLVYQDCIEAALAMPVDSAVRLVPRFREWLKERIHLFLPEKVGSLISKLAENGRSQQALDLASSLFEVLPGEFPTEGEGRPRRLGPEPQARLDAHEYDRLMRKHMPNLVAATGARALTLLSDLLDNAVRFSLRDADTAGDEDYSYIWCKAVDRCGPGHFSDLNRILVSATRAAVEQAVKEGRATLREVVDLLEGRRWTVFHRLALHVLALFPEQGLELATARLGDRGRFDDSRIRHEYNSLAQSCFGRLHEADQVRILEWIDAGPDLLQFRDTRERWTGTRPTDAEAQQYAERLRLERLAPIKGALPEEWKRRYSELVSKHGEPAPFPFEEAGGYVGRESPLPAEKLGAMSVAEIVSFLKEWEPPRDPFGPSPEGLAQVLQTAVASEPERFSHAIDEFLMVQPAYVSALLQGLRDAVKQKWNPEWWRPVLAFCQRLLAATAPTGEKPGSTGREETPGRWLRQLVAEVLSAGFEDGAGQVPHELRSAAWDVLRPLTDDLDPTTEREAERATSNLDALTISINSVRGHAMHAVVRYALWVRRHLEAQADRDVQVAGGLDEMPEVREVLETHLDPQHDPSKAIRSVYGQWFPWLCLLDEMWARAHAAAIFPGDEALRELWDAAWTTYITCCRPYNGVFQILEEQYRRAVQWLPERKDGSRSLGDPGEHLAEHLMVLYDRGLIDPDADNTLVKQFFRQAPPALRAHAIEFVGRSLCDRDEEVPSAVLDRFRILWGNRIAVAESAPNGHRRDAELIAFGWWFVCGKFEAEWALRQLRKTLRICSWTEPDHVVVGRLAESAGSSPEAVVECLGHLVEGDAEGWGIRLWREQLRSALSEILRTGDPASQSAARALVNRLGARGHLEYRDLAGVPPKLRAQADPSASGPAEP